VDKKINLRDVIKVRRQQPTRLEGFVDASFAFAMTLIVISIGHVPNTIEEMLHAMRGVPTFAVCFLLISRLWLGHRFFSRHYDIEDYKTVVLSLTLVFVMLLYVYPLRLMFSLMFAGLSHGWLADEQLVGTVDDLRGAYIVFGVGLMSISLIFVALFRHALSLADTIGLDANEVLVTHMRSLGWLCTAGVAMLSILVAVFIDFDGSRPWTYSFPGVVYWLLMFTRPTINAIIKRRLTAR
jgi:Endosomal/lysosomal potassium channel TMEM175